MQKISSYLYSNRIQVVADLASYPTEWRIVYQRMIKIYKGMDNVIEFDIKNAEQRRIVITGYNMKCVLMDQLGEEIYTADITPIPMTTGLATMTIPSDAIEIVKPQFLNYSVYILNDDDTKTPIYCDTQFGAVGKIDLREGALPKELPVKIINDFTYQINDVDPHSVKRTYYSEAANIRPPNTIALNPTARLSFNFSSLEGEVEVQVTKNGVVSSAVDWISLEKFDITPSTSSLEKIYTQGIDYDDEIEWLRIVYKPVSGTTGKIDKVIVRL